jgi:hypothetical protein
LILDVNDVRPIGDLGGRQLVAHFGKLCDIGLSFVRIAGARGAESPSEIGDGHDMRKFVRTDLKLCRAFPIATFHHLARR